MLLIFRSLVSVVHSDSVNTTRQDVCDSQTLLQFRHIKTYIIQYEVQYVEQITLSFNKYFKA